MASFCKLPTKRFPAALALLFCAAAGPAWAQDAAAPPDDVQSDETAAPADEVATTDGEIADVEVSGGSGTDILSPDTFTIQLDARAVLADGHTSWVDGGLGKTRFSGTDDGDFKARLVPVEAALIWQPRIGTTLAGNVSVVWQKDQDEKDPVDLMEAYVAWVPPRGSGVGISAKAGLYWPEISMEHATGGAWSTVNVITPSAINSWVGEEVKVLGAEATVTGTLGDHQLSLTGGAFGYNDTSGTLLSFRGWALHDLKATARGHFPLPPLNSFMTFAQEHRTQSLIELDDRVGFYGRLGWKPPAPIVVNAFYYDNRGDPEVFNDSLQWGWRTRFLNVGLGADLSPTLHLTAQGMTGTTLMGFETNGVIWVDTLFQSAFVSLTKDVGDGAITGRVEAFRTKERGSQMDDEAESEDGWALTAAGRWPLGPYLTGFVEALHVRSERGRRLDLGIPRTESQTVLQAALRFSW